jgi:hypothetical protein
MSYSREDIQSVATVLKDKFAADRSKSIELIGTNISTSKELKKFITSDPYEKLLEKGILALRQGFYQIINTPFYRDYFNGPSTFAAKVFYYAEPEDISIKYEANIGPMINSHGLCESLGGDKSQDQLFFDYQEWRNNDTHETYYYNSKMRFFQQVFEQKKIFYIHSSEFTKSVPKQKIVTWSFFS